ncbi:MAG: hypothetical protein ACRDIA_03705, partial [Actinomycetota bacterium]
GLGRIFHPGKVSFREKKATDALHILIEGSSVSAHIDKHSPLALRKARPGYSLLGVAAHNLSGIAQDAARFLTGRLRRHRYELECQTVTPEGEIIENFLQRPRSAEFLSGEDLKPETGGDRPPEKAPFSVIDEAAHLLDTEAAPWSIQLEVRVAGTLEEARLESAIAAAVDRHPMAGARKAAARQTGREHHWELGRPLDLNPLRTLDCPDDASLQEARAELQSMSVPLAESPPLRARLARNPGGDFLMLNLSHAATDGVGALRLLRSIAREYAGRPDPVARVDFLAARDLPGRLAAPGPSARLRRYNALLDKSGDLINPPARLHPQQPTERPGYGFHLETLSHEQSRRVTETRSVGGGEDVLIATLHLAISQWNSQHGAPCRRVGVLVPANLRPPNWRDETVGNFSLPTRTFTNPRHRRDPAAALDAIATQTARNKECGMGTALIELMRVSRRLPLWVKQTSVALLPLTGNRLVDTAVISNLGGGQRAPSFGPDAGETTEMWYSMPARMPLGLSVGTATVDGRLHLSFRYRHRMFGPAAARRFAAVYLEQLAAITEQVEQIPPHRLVVGRPEASGF